MIGGRAQDLDGDLTPLLIRLYGLREINLTSATAAETPYKPVWAKERAFRFHLALLASLRALHRALRSSHRSFHALAHPPFVVAV
jgi:hypothetical protein